MEEILFALLQRLAPLDLPFDGLPVLTGQFQN
jgi:hypothetical protein